jgi:hypothetical protein
MGLFTASSIYCLLCVTDTDEQERSWRPVLDSLLFDDALFTVRLYLKSISLLLMSRDSSVGIELGYGLDDRGSRARFPVGADNFSLHHRVQNGSGAHPACPMGTSVFFSGGKATGA